MALIACNACGLRTPSHTVVLSRSRSLREYVPGSVFARKYGIDVVPSLQLMIPCRMTFLPNLYIGQETREMYWIHKAGHRWMEIQSTVFAFGLFSFVLGEHVPSSLSKSAHALLELIPAAPGAEWLFSR